MITQMPKPKFKAGQILDEVCSTVGITKRHKPGTTVLCKGEIIKLHSYLKLILSHAEDYKSKPTTITD